MSPEETYGWLIGGVDDSFDVHVVASILALSRRQAIAEGRPISETAGFDGRPAALLAMFPHASALFETAGTAPRGEDELCLVDLLRRGATTGSQFEDLLAGMIARRAQRSNHLWQDLGLRNRGELSALMARHFAPLARRNRSDMKWKKFFFRIICRDADYALCSAPSCGECCDFDACFSEETGESLLAHIRRDAEARA
jgi:nitrogen fixation protein NifQ